MTATSWLQANSALRPPEAPGMGRGFAFAVLAHIVLVAALSAGVQWRTQTLPVFEAELWSAVPQAAAPKEVMPPEPESVPVPTPVAKPEPRPTPPDTAQAERDAEIAIAKARDKKKLEAERLADLEAERRKTAAAALKEKTERDKLDKLKQDKLKLQEKQEKQEKQAQQDRQDKAASAKSEAQRQENLRRIQGMAGASGSPTATGSALQSSGPSATYGGRIKARIRPNIIYTETSTGNPVAEVEVRVAPDGSITGRKLLKPSGDADWDAAVLRAIDKTETLPRDVDGRVPSLLVISFKPRE